MRHGGRLAVMGEASVWHSKVLPLFLPLLLFQADILLISFWSELPYVWVFQHLLCPCDTEVVPHPCSQGMLGAAALVCRTQTILSASPAFPKAYLLQWETLQESVCLGHRASSTPALLNTCTDLSGSLVLIYHLECVVISFEIKINYIGHFIFWNCIGKNYFYFYFKVRILLKIFIFISLFAHALLC